MTKSLIPTMTADEYDYVIQTLNREGLGWSSTETYQQEQRANARAEQLIRERRGI